MGFDIPFIDLPDIDFGSFAKGKAIELLNHLGYEWPTTQTSTLDAWPSNNQGPTALAFQAHMDSDDSFLQSVASLAAAAPLIATGYSAAAKVVVALKLAVIGAIRLDAIALGIAIVSGGMAAGVSFLAKQGAGALISILIDQAVMELVGG
ncbi:hypothetical protein [Tessaracoccus antarcticus]|uniref:Uncharacterized protein n=1 Tax=Tessaracoccus antarcticus TaxID=2479848 RepID=A0A3M0GKQ3_9ACTN|nr:hypothetical protein [Tessaracoccus antarcticus]RMB61729.1 hypothetical protein EAX62_03645 [Tessaracoccus antarcticus]